MNELNKSKKLNFAYSIFTLIFFSVQLRIVIDTFYFEKNSFIVLFYCLLFLKLGELVNELIVINATKLFAVLGTISLFMIIYMNGFFVFVGCFIFGFCLMKVRDKTIQHSTKKIKFTARAIGFVLSPILPYILLVILCIMAMIAIVTTRFDEDISDNFSLQWYDGSVGIVGNLCMGIHHFHYFSYAYSIPLAFFIFTSINSAWLGLIFYIGWAAYNAYERIIKPSWNYLFIGHIVAAVSLIMLANNHTIASMTFWWFMTGLGGGTVYMIQSLSNVKCNSSTELKISEGFGHVFGILAWGGSINYLGVDASFIFGAIGGILVAIISLCKIFIARQTFIRRFTK
ncbi:Uncharacterised protein [Yersinia intermedia]|jgi:hypothetical protein|uniref:hypothetical protein n=1 Tax=Yersinia intermedia TaxID=631 RepID=UPI0001A531E4|nr:hypothetical protein [Yersinia intermedia]EEQ16968.1 hypothetical protein yinte0001_4010 [Yersinia intermedia ATCC 29909]VDZ51388.1 Uncharacterised protein [Yersinia intermedia]